MDKKKDILKKIAYIAFVLFLFYIIFELTRKILGGSLGFEELVIALLVANLGYAFHLRESVSKLDTKITGHIAWHRGKENAK